MTIPPLQMMSFMSHFDKSLCYSRNFHPSGGIHPISEVLLSFSATLGRARSLPIPTEKPSSFVPKVGNFGANLQSWQFSSPALQKNILWESQTFHAWYVDLKWHSVSVPSPRLPGLDWLLILSVLPCWLLQLPSRLISPCRCGLTVKNSKFKSTQPCLWIHVWIDGTLSTLN